MSLKEDYLKHKKLTEVKERVKLLHELNENTILFEDLDMNKISQMADSVSKLEQAIGNLPNVPALKQGLEQAVRDMENLVSGKQGALQSLMRVISKDRLKNPITNSMALFSALHTLFATNMPQILKAFRADKPEFKDTPILKIQGINQKGLEDAFTKALRPAGVLGFLGLKTVPYIGNPTQVARELLNLTPTQIQGVTSATTPIQVPLGAKEKADLAGMAQGKPPLSLVKQANGEGGGNAEAAGGGLESVVNQLKGMWGPQGPVNAATLGKMILTGDIASIKQYLANTEKYKQASGGGQAQAPAAAEEE